MQQEKLLFWWETNFTHFSSKIFLTSKLFELKNNKVSFLKKEPVPILVQRWITLLYNNSVGDKLFYFTNWGVVLVN